MILGIFMLICMATGAAAQKNIVTLYIGSEKAYVNDREIFIDPKDSGVQPVLRDGRVLVPVRFIAENFGAGVDWDPTTASVDFLYEGNKMTLPIGRKEMHMNGSKKNLEVPAQIIRGRTFVPLRALVEALGKNLTYYQGLITISDKDFPMDGHGSRMYELLERYQQDSLRIPILMYHHFQPEVPFYLRDTTVTPREFEGHLAALKKEGYTSISFEEFYNYRVHNKPLPLKPYILTIDDGYFSNYQYAFPLLKKYNVKAAISVVTSFRGKTPGGFPHFSWEEAREMEDSGLIEIQNHSTDHRNQADLSQEEFTLEVLEAQQEIEKHLGKRKVKVFTYPMGKCSEGTKKVLSDLGFHIQLGVRSGVVSNQSDLTELNRINISHGISGQELIHRIENLKK